MRNIFTLKKVMLITILLFGFILKAQTYYVDGLSASTIFTVDTDTSDGKLPDGSEGSWYKWDPKAGITTTATFTAGDDVDNPGVDDSNEATVAWNASWPTINGDPLKLIQDYKITAEEFNKCQSTTTTATSKTEIDVKLVKPDLLKIEGDSNACVGTDANITLYGTPGAIANYSVTNSSTTATTSSFDTKGIAHITVTPNGSGDMVLTVASVTFKTTQPAPLSTNFETTATAFSVGTGNVITIASNKAPTISPIKFK